MTTTTEFQATNWQREPYTAATDYYQQFTTDPEFLEFTGDLNPDELLRLALFADNGSWRLVPEDLPALIAQEQDAFTGEYESGAEFAEELATDLGEVVIPEAYWVIVDWQASYDRNLCHDYFDYTVIDQDGNYRRFFWNANV